jgi:opacity protein-like surface antigen
MSKKKCLILISSLASFSIISVANAQNYFCPRPPICTTGGIVIGVQGGYANTHWDNVENIGNNPISDDLFEDVDSSTSKDDGFAGRVYLGFDITPFFGIESGYAFLPNANITTFFEDGTDVAGNIKNYAIDVLAKLMIPVVNGFSVYAKAGAGYFHSDFQNFSSTNPDIEVDNSNDSASHIGPAYGVGAAYEVIPNLVVDLSWMRYSGDNHLFNNDGSFNNDYQPNPDLILVGISYKFPLYSYGV